MINIGSYEREDDRDEERVDPSTPLQHSLVHKGLTPQEKEANFKTWFGNSVVVDKDGNPLRVYHASRNKFNAFKPSNRIDVGVHFGNALSADKIFNYEDAQDIESVLYYPVYLRLENPIEFIDPLSWTIDDIGEKLVELGIMSEGMRRVLVKKFNQSYFKFINTPSPAKGSKTIPIEVREVQRNIIDLCKAKGYDGFIYVNRAEIEDSDIKRMTAEDYDSPNEDFLMKFKSSSWSYCVFSPNQIKSVYNRGTYSLESDNLSESIRG